MAAATCKRRRTQRRGAEEASGHQEVDEAAGAETVHHILSLRFVMLHMKRWFLELVWVCFYKSGARSSQSSKQKMFAKDGMCCMYVCTVRKWTEVLNVRGMRWKVWGGSTQWFPPLPEPFLSSSAMWMIFRVFAENAKAIKHHLFPTGFWKWRLLCEAKKKKTTRSHRGTNSCTTSLITVAIKSKMSIPSWHSYVRL